MELALCLPLLAVVVAAALEVVLLGVDQVRLWHAAREAARVAVVEPDQAEARRAVDRVGLEQVDVSIDPEAAYRVRGRPLEVNLVYHPVGHVPLLSALIERLELRASATMRIEEP